MGCSPANIRGLRSSSKSPNPQPKIHQTLNVEKLNKRSIKVWTWNWVYHASNFTECSLSTQKNKRVNTNHLLTSPSQHTCPSQFPSPKLQKTLAPRFPLLEAFTDAGSFFISNYIQSTWSHCELEVWKRPWDNGWGAAGNVTEMETP
jgi:hypothetical protein